MKLRRKMKVDCGKKVNVSLLTVRRLLLPPRGDTPFILQDDEGPHLSITCRKTEAVIPSGALRRQLRLREKGLS